MPADVAPAQVPDLETLARAHFKDLTKAELKLLRGAPKGELAVCGPNANVGDPANDPANAGNWGPKREIRAGLIRWLCVHREAKEQVDPKGIQVLGAKITGALDLSYVIVPFGLTLWRCRLMGEADLSNVEIPEIYLEGTWVHSISADRARVKGSVFLRKGFRSEGEVRLLGAQIGGSFDCSGGTFTNPPKQGIAASGDALSADAAVVKGDVFLRNGFRAEGQVRLPGAQIGGDLVCTGGTFTNPPKQGMDASGRALSASSAVVKGGVFLRNGFHAEGAVHLLGAQISGDLDCSGGTFTNPPIEGIAASGDALSAERVVVKGGVFLRDGFHAEGALNLTNASVGALVDDAPSWPASGNLFLDGFVYARISGDSPKGAKNRLDWLARQKDFSPQPYRQLAKVLRDDGDEDGARRVLVEMERRQRAASWAGQPWSWLLRWTIGYGYYPLRALGGLTLLSVLGWIIYRRALLAGSMTPTDKKAYQYYVENHAPPPHHTPFSPFVYSLENSLPLVELGQVDHWQPNPNLQLPEHNAGNWWARFAHWTLSPVFLRRFLWVQIIVGWILATLFVAGITGIVRKD